MSTIAQVLSSFSSCNLAGALSPSSLCMAARMISLTADWAMSLPMLPTVSVACHLVPLRSCSLSSPAHSSSQSSILLALSPALCPALPLQESLSGGAVDLQALRRHWSLPGTPSLSSTFLGKTPVSWLKPNASLGKSRRTFTELGISESTTPLTYVLYSHYVILIDCSLPPLAIESPLGKGPCLIDFGFPDAWPHL